MRRREMTEAGGAAPAGPLVYSLYDRAVAEGDVIDTGVKPFANGSDMTILFDMAVTKNPGTASSPSYRYCLLFAGSYYNICVYKPSQYNNNIRAIFLGSGDNDTAGKICSSAAGRKRIVITHVGGTRSIQAIGKDASGTPIEKTITPANTTRVLNENAVLTFGDLSMGDGYGLPPGTITKAEVYNTILPQAEIDAFLA